MPEACSALDAVYEVRPFPGSESQPGVSIHERPIGDLIMVSAWPDSFEATCRILSDLLSVPTPVSYRDAVPGKQCHLFMVAPRRVLIASEEPGLGRKLTERLAGDQAAVTELGHSRTLIRLHGPHARAVLARGLPVDLDASVFAPGVFAQSAIHHMPLLIHNVSKDNHHTAFDLYIPRSLAVSLWRWMTTAARPFGYHVLPRDERPLASTAEREEAPS